jgi:hypothetical protein
MNYGELRWQAVRFGGLFVAILIADRILHSFLSFSWMSSEAHGTAVLIPLIGEIYAVLLAFMIFVIWTQFTEVENCVLREANSLNELLRYTAFLPDDARTAIRRSVGGYVRLVLEQEWPELGDGRKDRHTEEAFAKLVTNVVSAAPKDDHGHLLEALRTVSRNRDERVAKSMTRMPPTLSGLVQLIAVVLWLLIYVYSFDSLSTGPLCYGIAALVLFIANFVMTDTDNPLKGLWNVRPDCFLELPR